MPLFVDEYSTKKVDFGDAWVKIRPLSRGEVDQEKAELAELGKGMIRGIKDGRAEINTDNIDSNVLANKVTELEYQRVKTCIVEWSSDREITVENIKKMPEGFYNKLLREIEALTSLSGEEVKN